MNFKAIENRARTVAAEAAAERVRQLRDQLAKEAALNAGVWGPTQEFLDAWAPMAAHLQQVFTQRNISAYHDQAEQAAIDALKAIINAPKP